MARITLDDDFWPLAARLGAIIGDVHRAAGMMVAFKNFAQNKFKNGRAVTREEMTFNDFDLRMVGVCIVEVESGYQWWNAESEFGWLKTRAESGKRGGIKSSEVRWGHSSDSDDLRVSKRKQTVSKRNPLPLPLSLEEKELLRSSPPSRKKSAPVVQVTSANEMLGVIDPEIFAQWRQLYSPEYAEREMSKMVVWLKANPKKSRKTPRGWVQFVASWLERGWDRHVNQGPSQKSEVVDNWLTAAQKVSEAVRRYHDWSKEERAVRAMIGDDVYELAIKAGVYKIRSLPSNDFYLRAIMGMLKESKTKIKLGNEKGQQ